MSFSRAFQWYHSHLDPIWPDGTFNYFITSVIQVRICIFKQPKTIADPNQSIKGAILRSMGMLLPGTRGQWEGRSRWCDTPLIRARIQPQGTYHTWMIFNRVHVRISSTGTLRTYSTETLQEKIWINVCNGIQFLHRYRKTYFNNPPPPKKKLFAKQW